MLLEYSFVLLGAFFQTNKYQHLLSSVQMCRMHSTFLGLWALFPTVSQPSLLSSFSCKNCGKQNQGLLLELLALIANAICKKNKPVGSDGLLYTRPVYSHCILHTPGLPFEFNNRKIRFQSIQKWDRSDCQQFREEHNQQSYESFLNCILFKCINSSLEQVTNLTRTYFCKSFIMNMLYFTISHNIFILSI